MQSDTTTRRSLDRGFTLVELLVVIIVLGVLAAVTIFAMRGTAASGTQAVCNTDFDVMTTAQEVHHAMHGTFADEATLVTADVLHSPSDNFEVTGDATSFQVTPVPGSGCTETAAVALAAPASGPTPGPTARAATSDPTHDPLSGVTAWRYPLGNQGSAANQFLVLGRANAWADWNAANDAGVSTSRRTHFVDLDSLNAGQMNTLFSAMASNGNTTIIVYVDDDSGTLGGTSAADYIDQNHSTYSLTNWVSATRGDGQLASLFAAN